jgi:transposase
MDTSSQPAKRQRRSTELKRQIVEATLVPGASVAQVARAHGVNANQVFGWRKLYLAGRLGAPVRQPKALLPVTVADPMAGTAILSAGNVPECGPVPSSNLRSSSSSAPGSRIEIKFRKAEVRIEGNADPALLRAVLECLRR